PLTPPVLDKENYVNLINPMYFSGDKFLFDPDFSMVPADLRANPKTAPNPLKYMGTSNPSYTYPDLNTMFLAPLNAKRQILLQSFHRPWTGAGSLDPNLNPNWAATWGLDPTKVPPAMKYKTMRPLPSQNVFVDPVSGTVKSFPAPDDGGGDVKNWFF